MAANNNPKQGSGISKGKRAGGEHVKTPSKNADGGVKLGKTKTSNLRMAPVDPVPPQHNVRR